MQFLIQSLLLLLETINTSKDNILRDPIWNSVGVVVAIIFGILSLLVAWKQFQRKSLEYQLISANNILEIPDIHEKIEVRLNSNVIRNFYVILLKFNNKGNATIEENDFSEKITIELGQNVKLLSVKILQQPTAREGLRVSLKEDGDRGYVRIEPFLLNGGEFFTLQITADSFEKVMVNGRISGVKRILESNRTSPNLSYLIILFPAMILGYFLSKLPLNLLLIILSIVIFCFFFFAIQSMAGV
ncbi:MAG: hypothetical protein DSM106950_03790 [Stigonema ocellatum SAG 48.90 = DSM 106950]|nr:hypothetical protein [Stigonema ocellatum SAG 48.90 = DSM 106950]